MATFDLPSSLKPATMEWGSIKAGVQFRSPFNGNVESVEFPGERWRASLTFSLGTPDLAAQAEAFFARVAGGSERVRLRHFLRPAPVGTMRGSPTLNTAAARGDLQVLINTTGTLKAGDFFKVGGQLFQCFADCSPAGSVLTVPLVQRVRATLTVGASVTWDRPTALFICPSMSFAAGYSPGQVAPMAVDFEEVFS
jgi:hypothetical protein